MMPKESPLEVRSRSEPVLYRLRWFKGMDDRGQRRLYVVAERRYRIFWFFWMWSSVDGIRYTDEHRAFLAIQFDKIETPTPEEISLNG